MAKATKSSPGTALTKWEERLAQAALNAAKIVKDVGGGGNFLSLKSGVLTYQKLPIPNNTMNVIVLAQILENQLYTTKYSADKAASPVCYGFGEDRKTMKPHKDVEGDDFVWQGEKYHLPVSAECDGCPMKEFGSADTGSGKACGDVLRLALITANDMGEGKEILDAELAYLKLPFFSTKEWAAYIRDMDGIHHRSPVGSLVGGEAVPPGLATKITVVPDSKSQFLVKFDLVDPLDFGADEKLYPELAQITARAMKEIGFAYPKFEEAPAKAPARGNGRTPPVRGRR